MNKKTRSLSLAALLAAIMAMGCHSNNSSPSKTPPTDDAAKPYYEITGNEKDKNITVSWCLIGGPDEYYQYKKLLVSRLIFR